MKTRTSLPPPSRHSSRSLILSVLTTLALVPLAAQPLAAQDATLPPLGKLHSQQEAPLIIKVRNCLVDVIVNIADKATGKTAYRKHMDMGKRHSFSLTWWGKAGEYQISIVPANGTHASIFNREIVRECTLTKGEQSTLDVDFEENRPADMAPLPTEEQIDQFCQGDTQALQQYLGDPNRVLLVYEYDVTVEPNTNERMSKLYGLVKTTKVMVLQSTDPNISPGERLQWAHVLETGPDTGAALERHRATPFQPSLKYIINPHKVGEGKLHGETDLNIFPMEKRRRYLYLRASHTIQGIPA